MVLQLIYSGNYVPNFIRIAEFCKKNTTKNILVSFFPATVYLHVLPRDITNSAKILGFSMKIYAFVLL